MVKRPTRLEQTMKDLENGIVKDADIPTIRHIFKMLYGDIKKNDFDDTPRREWPFQLLVCIYGDRDLMIDDSTLALIEPRVDYCVRYSLSKVESKIIFKRFKEFKSLEKVAEELGNGVTRERVRQLEAKALRKLRHPKNLYQINYGQHYIAQMEEMRERAKNREEELAAKVALLQSKIDKADAVLKDIDFGFDKKYGGTDLAVLNLTNKVAKYLHFGFIDSVESLVMHSKERLKENTLLNDDDIREIEEKLFKFGYVLGKGKVNQYDDGED